MSRYSKSMSDTMAEVRANEEKLLEVSPPGFKGTVKAMKKHDEIDNPYALAWHMKNKGDEAHYKNKDGKPEKKEKFKEGTAPEPKPKLSKKDAKTLGKVADLMKKQREEDVDEANLPPHLSKFFDKKGNPKPEVAKRMAAGQKKRVVAYKSKDVTPKGYGPNEEVEAIEEGSKKSKSPDNAMRGIEQARHAIKKITDEQSRINDMAKRELPKLRKQLKDKIAAFNKKFGKDHGMVKEGAEVEEGFGKLKDASKNLAKMRKAAGVKVDKQITKKLPSGSILRKTTYKKEEAELEEAREKLGRQLIDPKKEVMVVRKNKVVVINKKDQDKYLKMGWQLAESVEVYDVDALHAEALQENELLNEVEWKVQLRGLPVFYVPAKSAGEVRAMLRKQIKKPDDIISVERVSKGEKKKDFRARVQEK